MSNEDLASKIARERGTTLPALNAAGRDACWTKIRRIIARALADNGCSQPKIARILGRAPGYAYALLHPIKHKLRCKLYQERHRVKKAEMVDFDVSGGDHCKRCGLRGEHECLTRRLTDEMITRRLEVV